jgi:5,10-methenyltetrahydrofolate synthetase
MTAADDIAQQKAALRWAMLDKRDALALDVREKMNPVITAKLIALPVYQQAKTILAYMNIGSEFDAAEFIADVLARGKVLVLPKVNKASKTLDIFQVKNPAIELLPGVWGIAEPDPTLCKSISISQVDLVLVPGLAFDITGQRVGYGGGYYDKLLAGCDKKTRLIAAAYSMQMVPAVPALSHDLKVEMVITENSI